MYKAKVVEVNGEKLKVYRVNNDVNGNPRYVVHFLALGIIPTDYGNIPGLTKYRAKWFGGGYVFQSYNLEDSLKHMLNVVADFYR